MRLVVAQTLDFKKTLSDFDGLSGNSFEMREALTPHSAMIRFESRTYICQILRNVR